MLKDPVFRECGFQKPYFCIAGQREDEIIVTFERGKCFFINFEDS